MKKIILSAMALVLGLFTVTALFAFSLKSEGEVIRQGDIYYFNHDGFNPDDDWKEEAAWEPGTATSPDCPGTPEILCRIRLNENQELMDFLTPIPNLDALLANGQVDQKVDDTQ